VGGRRLRGKDHVGHLPEHVPDLSDYGETLMCA
jgi:hypothetical protein